jgi:hypothetical protein
VPQNAPGAAPTGLAPLELGRVEVVSTRMHAPLILLRHRGVELVTTAVLLAASCGGGSGGGGSGDGPPGTEADKPGGGTFFVDAHSNGAASRLHLPEIVWGRLVDVHALLASGAVDPEPVFRDLVVSEAIIGDGFDFTLETNPVTQRTRLVVLRVRRAADLGSGTF